MFSEHDIDKELRAQLSVTPSPDFEARVRRAIDEDAAAPRRWWAPSYTFAAAAAAVILTTTVAVVTLRQSDDAPVRETQRAGRDVRLEASSPEGLRYGSQGRPASPSVVAQPFRAARRSVTPTLREPEIIVPLPARRVTPPSRTRKAPEIIVPLNQMEALRRLVNALDEGRVALADIPEGPVAPPAELVVEPLVVEPPMEPDGKGSIPNIQRPQ